MSSASEGLTTGLTGLDEVLKGLLAGDNIVWQVDDIDDYLALVRPYCEAAKSNGKRIVYFRFASHEPLMSGEYGAEIHELKPEGGFESFISSIHGVIEGAGRGAFYVFDCLSELAVDWYSDQMLGNFFMLTCPYLYDMETITYFALFRNRHSSRAIRPIYDTTQLFLEVYKHEGVLCIHPLKVQHRYSPTMNMLHAWRGSEFKAVTSSALISEVLSSVNWQGLHSDGRQGFWERAFGEARELLDAVKRGTIPVEKGQERADQFLRMVVSRDPGMLKLASSHMDIEDVVNIRRRMIGTGLVGGKTVGMLVARNILKRANPRFRKLLEEQDSFYVGSDVFYTFLVANGVWWVREKQRNPATFLDGAEQARQRILTGKFPDYIIKEFEQMLDYFGQFPIIVRSSSLLEDNFGNSFAGKYESVFCANQGPRERRLEDFLAAVRTIYASSMSEKALRYRERRGILGHDEQMALLVMRVSGAMYGRHYYPHAAGVGFSFNPYAWSKYIDPKAGVLRLVFGLGTRAVDRSDDDYTRIVALNAPARRPESNFAEIRQYAQHRMDYLDLAANQLVSGDFMEVAKKNESLPIEMFGSIDTSDQRPGAAREWVLTFDQLLSETDLVADMRTILNTLQTAYDYPVDIEFTLNFLEDGNYRINLVQCRPLPVQGGEAVNLPVLDVSEEKTILRAHGAVIGKSRLIDITRMVYVVASEYSILTQRDRFEIARLVGKVVRVQDGAAANAIMLIGPGRWGTSTPSLGIPVSFAEINRAAVVCEVASMSEQIVPDVSLGTHFLNELVEMDMLYVALFPDEKGNYLDSEFFETAPNALAGIVPDAAKWERVVRVVQPGPDSAVSAIKLHANALEQEVVCYLE
ncbi:MAG: pyruvate, phosphate dikinase [Lentisphaerales bacterium]|jgi:hypothetical protein|nr:MAG: pyruvate, phosphate dikinase [Lentisphaerales bacterium]